MRRPQANLAVTALAVLLALFVAACAYVSRQPVAPTSATPPVAARQRAPAVSLPTANHFLFVAGREPDFYQPVAPDRPHTAQYGCTRIGASGEDGTAFHEGIDIRCQQRDARGEPIDAVMAIADGVVAYVNPVASASNYGIYVVVRHEFHDAVLYSLYAHLSSLRPNCRAGQRIARGQTLGVMGRTSNEFKNGLIPQERAHLHLEICLMASPYFAEWSLRKNKRPVEHGNFNGRNLIGLDPAAFITAAQRDSWFTVRKFLDAQTAAFSVLFDARQPIALLAQNPWLLRPPQPIKESVAIPPPVVAVEVFFDHTGFPLRAMPRRSSELDQDQQRAVILQRTILASINEPELARNNCRGLVRKDGNRWVLTARGAELMEIYTFTP